jgi:superfamily II DNA or RNA helicase
LVVPRHHLDNVGLSCSWTGPSSFPLLDDRCFITPRDQLQEDARQFLGQHGLTPADSDVIVSLRCGEGKTFIGLRSAFDYGYHTLILAHTTDILLNWIKVVKATTTCKEVGTIISGSFDLQPVTVALIQSLLALPPEQMEVVRKAFGCILCDEMHHLAAPIFSAVGNTFPGRRVGLSATLAREDGLSMVYYKALGKRVFWRSSARKKAAVLMRKVRVTDIDFPDNYARAVTYLENSNQYLNVLETDIRAGYDLGQKQLVICTRKVILRELERRLKDLDPGLNTRETLPDVRADNLVTKRVILSIDYFGKEGLDEASLTTIRVITPVRDRNAVTQTVGRLERDVDKGDITAIFYSPTYGMFLHTLQKAREALIREGYRVHDQ